jgi:hypothetical protein
VTASEDKEIVRKLRRAAEGNLPAWAVLGIGMGEIADLLLLVDTITDLRKNEEVRARVIRELRAAQQWVVARDGGRYCERCEQEVSRGEAYEYLPGTGGLIAHVHCPHEGDKP